MCVKLTSSLGVDIKLIDGVPQWSARGADSFSPFNVRDYSSMVNMKALGSVNNNVTYHCIKDTEALIFATGTQYNSTSYIRINGENIWSTSGTTSINFFEKVELKAGDKISMSINIGSAGSNFGAIAGMLHNGGIY